MVAAALADGHLDPREQQAILGHLASGELGEEQVRQVHQDLVLPPGVEELAASVHDAEGRELLYRFAALVIAADQQVSYQEREWLETLALALRIDEDRRQELEREVLG
ncbi:MAG TPA: DUF533 domain-containing protein [Thermoanaerobaculia bacterium]|nr:DUF533 domain-containing protein [Thermoanaerobaculia bacterium]